MKITRVDVIPEHVVPERAVTLELGVKCDLCGKMIVEGTYDVDEVECFWREGFRSAEGGNGTITKVDLCGKCFKTRLVPWLESQGASARKEEWDY